jgi:tetratricopeptide (TPR) repeat protein
VSSYPECTVKPTTDDSDAAKNAYLFGKRKYDEAEYATAVNYFKDAYKTDCTKHEILIIISRSYELSGNKAEAINALETYLKRVPNAQDADVQKKRIANLKAQVAPTLGTVTPPPTATATATATPTATANPSSTATTAPTSTPPGGDTSPSSGGNSITPWIVVGAGTVILATGVVLVIVGAGNVSSTNDKLKAAGCDVNNPAKPCTAGPSVVNPLNDKLTSAKTLETIGGVGIGVGIAGIAAGLVWHFVFDKPHAAEKSATTLGPQVAPGYAGLGAAGSF